MSLPLILEVSMNVILDMNRMPEARDGRVHESSLSGRGSQISLIKEEAAEKWILLLE